MTNIDNFVGIQRTYRASGKVKSEVFMNNNKKEGKYKKFYMNGQIKIICNYINDNLNGELVV